MQITIIEHRSKIECFCSYTIPFFFDKRTFGHIDRLRAFQALGFESECFIFNKKLRRYSRMITFMQISILALCYFFILMPAIGSAVIKYPCCCDYFDSLKAGLKITFFVFIAAVIFLAFIWALAGLTE